MISSQTCRALVLLLCLSAFFWFAPCHAAEPIAAASSPVPSSGAEGAQPGKPRAPKLVSDEPNTLGVAWDGYDGHAYMDFNLSMRYPLGYDAITEGRSRYSGMWLPYFSFSARASQYFGRRSAPVVTKRYNPKLMLRMYESEPPEGRLVWADDIALDYHDFGYAHESNGQYVNSPEAFNAVASNFGSAEIAQDYVHRGWDYLDYRRHTHFRVDRRGWLDLELKYFLRHGLAQTSITELYPWEIPGKITHIGQVDGVRLTAGIDVGEDWFKNGRLTWYTGYRDFARYNTVRAEATFAPLSRWLGVPVVLWAQSGYDNSVAHFYQHSWFAGIAGSFETGQ